MTPVQRPGGFWIRLVAVIIDSCIIRIIGFPIGFGFGIAITALHTDQTTELLLTILSGIVSAIISVIYFCWFYKHKGGTPGKLLFNLRVVDTETGLYLTFGQTLLRELIGKPVGALILGIGFLMAGFRSDKRALHDFIAGSRVLKIQSS